MSVFVVDASVAAKWFFKEENGEEALSVLDESNQTEPVAADVKNHNLFPVRQLGRTRIAESLAHLGKMAPSRPPYH